MRTMRNFKRLSTLAILILSVMFITSCKKSILSDMVITDPSIVKVSVKIYQNEKADKEVAVVLRDGNNHTIELKNGSVVVNGRVAAFQHTKINPTLERGYVIKPFDYEDSFYVLINLNDDDSYSFSVDAQNGFPGFYRDEPLSGSELYYDGNYINKDFYIYNKYFMNDRVRIVYRILKPKS